MPSRIDSAAPDRLIRRALWAAVVLNAAGVAAFAPLTVGASSPLVPVAVSPYLAAQLVFTIALFGGVYAWLAKQARINRAVVVIGALGKLGFVVVTCAYAIAGELPARMALSAAPDLVFAIVFVWWARATT